ncbi:response regulator transcription factor [Micromonospora sp. KC723]|uniref:LuxR C-terminal-related transcriptional regulator n=1 Tax=Micromonospora sp. KC723 TaxID=2530381 RepID=UPI001049C62F|nr:response regulator transcription factor [Micromonospora sp. KC723]TDB78264.1 response regulator transcription factor [Micromonospora sp. KC723]
MWREALCKDSMLLGGELDTHTPDTQAGAVTMPVAADDAHPLRVLLCNDRPLLLDGLCSLLGHETDITVIGTADTTTQAMALAHHHRPQVVVTGARLHQVPAADLVRRLRQEPLDPPPRVIVFALSAIDDHLADVLYAGASGLLGDDAGREEMAMAIRAVARGHAMLGPRIAQRLMEWFRESRSPARSRVDLPVGTVLTPREKEILTLAAHGLSTDDIATKLFIGTATVRTHLYRLQMKLQLKDRAQLVSFAFRAGIVNPV